MTPIRVDLIERYERAAAAYFLCASQLPSVPTAAQAAHHERRRIDAECAWARLTNAEQQLASIDWR